MTTPNHPSALSGVRQQLDRMKGYTATLSAAATAPVTVSHSDQEQYIQALEAQLRAQDAQIVDLTTVVNLQAALLDQTDAENATLRQTLAQETAHPLGEHRSAEYTTGWQDCEEHHRGRFAAWPRRGEEC